MHLGNGEARPRLGTSISGVLRRFRLTEAMQSRKSCPQVQSRFRSKHKHSDLESHDLESHHGGEYRDPAEYCTWCTCTVVRAQVRMFARHVTRRSEGGMPLPAAAERS